MKCLPHPTLGPKAEQAGSLDVSLQIKKLEAVASAGQGVLGGCGPTRLFSCPFFSKALLPTFVEITSMGSTGMWSGINACESECVAVYACGQACGYASVYWGEAEVVCVGS